MKNYDSNYKFVDSVEEFIKESIDNGKKNIVIQQTHDFGQIQLEFAPKTMLISGTVYSFTDNETEKCYQLQVKDLAYEDANYMVFTSAIYAYLSEAWKIANMLQKVTIQSTAYAK